VPQIQIADLRPLDGDNAADVPGANAPGFSRPYGHHELLKACASVSVAAKTTIERCIHSQR
jgi:hypothetical protein